MARIIAEFAAALWVIIENFGDLRAIKVRVFGGIEILSRRPPRRLVVALRTRNQARLADHRALQEVGAFYVASMSRGVAESQWQSL
jgi:hypothetical protein